MQKERTNSKTADLVIAPTLGRRIMGVVLIPASLCPLLALLTYDFTDISLLHVPANSPPTNLMGIVGAWLTFCGYALIGFGVWLIPVAIALVGALMAFGRPVHLQRRLAWGVLLLLSLSALLQLAQRCFTELMIETNITPNAGGVIGQWLMTCFLERWLNPVGGGIVAAVLCFIFAVMTIGTSTIWEGFCILRERYERHMSDAERQKKEAERAEREAAREQARAAKEASRAAREAARDRARAISVAAREAKEAEREERRLAKEREQQGVEERKQREAAERAEASREEDELRRQAAAMRAAAAREQHEAKAAETAPQRVNEVEEQAKDAEGEDDPLPPYSLPPLDLLDPLPQDSAKLGDMEQTAANLVAKFDEFNIQVEVTNIVPGPVVTQYEVLPGPGVRVEKIAAEVRNLQLALGVASLRVQAPIPNKKVCGIEVPNPVPQKVTLRQVLSGDTWCSGKHVLPLAMGKDVIGNDLVVDLASLPHMLVAGQTGSGKSVCLNAFLTGLLMSRTPEELRLILVDPKRVEFPPYNDLPHLLVPVITDPKKVAFALRWALGEMDKRLKMFQAARTRNIVAFNERKIGRQEDLFEQTADEGVAPGEDLAADGFPKKIPYIVIVIDEMSDLMMAVGKEIEASISRLAAVSRAAGIHMILATQRPSVDVITGTIKANIPGRVAFQVAQKNDSRIILDAQGAESLIGKGDMIFLDAKLGQMRAQGAWVGDDEITRVVSYIRENSRPIFDDSFKAKLDKVRELSHDIDEEDDSDSIPASGADVMAGGEAADSDEMLVRAAICLIRETRRASTSTLQRRLRIGFTRAGRIMDILEERGIIGPSQGAQARDILVDLNSEFNESGEPITGGAEEEATLAGDDDMIDDDLDDV
ncbi:MAG: DNA translocase FtsK [Lentisphaerae bacterium]|nr:DNA translocase FtsK [Lentisphaerota bacterium]